MKKILQPTEKGFFMKNNKSTTFRHIELSTINTQQYSDFAHKLRGETLVEHFGIIKNVFKKKSSATKFKK